MRGATWLVRWRQFQWQTVDRPPRSPNVVLVSWIGAWKASDLGFKRCGGGERVNHRRSTNAWRRVDSPMATSPPPNDRLAGEDFSGSAVFPFQRLEACVANFKPCGSAWDAWTRRPVLLSARGGAFHLQWRFFHCRKIDQRMIYPIVVVFVHGDGRNTDFEELGGSAANGGTWAANLRTVVAHESAWRLQWQSIQWLRWLLDWKLGSSSFEAHHAWRSLDARK